MSKNQLEWVTAQDLTRIIEGSGKKGQPQHPHRDPAAKIVDFLSSQEILDVLPYLSPGDRRKLDHLLTAQDVVLWLEKNFMIPEPRDPLTGIKLADEGPIKIAPYQAKVLREALRRDKNGHFAYSTILWSEIKKSGKTTIAAGVALYMAYTNINAEIYCIANDGRQSKDKIFGKIIKCIQLSSKLKGAFEGIRPTRDNVRFGHGSFIEPISCDPSGEAGGEPTMSVFSEIHGFRQTHKTRLWAELTIPPTKWGRALRWAESYAGYTGEDSILERLYDVNITNGIPHPDFPELPVFANQATKTFAFWNTEGRHAWHTPEYYAQEEANLPSMEYRRMHKNEWVTSVETFVQPEWWKACEGVLPAIDDDPLVVAMDAAVSDDSFAIVAVSRHPNDDKADDSVAVRYAQIWRPSKGRKIDYQGTEDAPGPERIVEYLCDNYNVVQITYDPYQLHDMASRLRREGLAYFSEFSQGGERLESDSRLKQLILHRRLIHEGNADLTRHINNSAAKIAPDSRKIRIVKLSESRKIDATVALSMAAHRCLELNL